MKQLKRYEELMEEFSYKSYNYAGDTIEIGIKENGVLPIFIMRSPELESKLNMTQKIELNNLLKLAMDEVVKYKKSDKSISDFLGWKA